MNITIMGTTTTIMGMSIATSMTTIIIMRTGTTMLTATGMTTIIMGTIIPTGMTIIITGIRTATVSRR